MALLLEFRHELTGCAVVFDDDDRVAYAYFRAPDGEVVGDVWLYNVAAAPAEVDLTRLELAPFLNPSPLAAPLEGPRPTAGDVTVRWGPVEAGLFVDVLVRGRALGRLAPEARPGWAALALADGPLARRWTLIDASG